MIWGDLVRLIIVGLLAGGGKPQPAPGPVVPPSPFPAPPPPDLPPWPTGWCPDVPPPPEVVSRAWFLLPELWAKGEGSQQVEMTGGRWITYVASTVNGQKSVAAYRSIDCEPVSPVEPPSPVPIPTAPPSDQVLIAAATTMNEALKLRGYKKADMPLYRDFQAKGGIAADGYPGTVTMLKLDSVLRMAGLTIAPVKVYPWKAAGAYDGVNAPTAAEWEGGAVPPMIPVPAVIPPPPPPPAAPSIIPAVTPSYVPPAPAPLVTAVNTVQDVQRALQSIGYLGADGKPLAIDGIAGANTTFAVRTYQGEHPPLAVDGIAGTQTKAALSKSLAANEHRAAPSAQPIPVILPSSGPTVVPPSGPPVLTNVDVQHALNLLNYKGADGKVLTEDGILGANSKYATTAFQREHPPLAVDGIAGTQTKAALSAAVGRLTLAA